MDSLLRIWQLDVQVGHPDLFDSGDNVQAHNRRLAGRNSNQVI